MRTNSSDKLRDGVASSCLLVRLGHIIIVYRFVLSCIVSVTPIHYRGGISTNDSTVNHDGNRGPLHGPALSVRSRISWSSSCESATSSAPRFSSRYCPPRQPRAHPAIERRTRTLTRLAPGIGMMSPPWPRSHASATCPALAPCRAPIAWRPSASLVAFGRFSLENLRGAGE